MTRIRFRHGLAVFGIVAALSAAGCAGKRVETPPPDVGAAARYPDFIFPAPVPGLGTPAALERHQAGWLWLQAGDLKAAERNFEAALKLAADFYPAHVALGYVGVAKEDQRRALEQFDHAIVANPRYVPALVGRGDALLALGDREQALKSFEAAVVADPSLLALRTRVDVLRVRAQQEDVAAARKALEAGRLEEARRAYDRAVAGSPDSPFLYRESAAVSLKLGDDDAALRQASKAVELEPTDARNHVLLAEVHEARGDTKAALTAYDAALAIERTDAAAAKAEALREKLALAAMPIEFTQIESSAGLSREQLAALVGVRLDQLLKRVQRPNAVVITDTRGSWATPWIMAVTRAGVMEVYPNHTFQPSAVVRRADLADAASRILSLIAAEKPELAAAWRTARRQFPDLPAAHLSYPAASLSVEAGVMQPQPDGSFQLTRPVTGAEAVAAVKKLEELAERAGR